MSYEKKCSYYHVNNFLLCEALENYDSLVQLATICGISSGTLQSAKKGSVLEKEDCDKLCKEIKIPFDELFTIKGKQRRYDYKETYLTESEVILTGLKNNIFKQLEVAGLNCHFQTKVEAVLNDLIIEASYLGVNAQLQGNTSFVEQAIQKRRGR